MAEALAFLTSHLHYLVPPLVGAFIGYLTNKVAIKMLFRPLKPWKFIGLRIPMTPGVIPSKRHELARNIGEMVGGHLLTSKEIGAALKKESFQNQLVGLIKDRVGGIMLRNLPSLPEVVPDVYRNYYTIAVKTVTYQTKQLLHNFVRSDEFDRSFARTVRNSCNSFVLRDVESLVSKKDRKALYGAVDSMLENMFQAKSIEQWTDDFIYTKVHSLLKNERSLADILPASLHATVLDTVERKTPEILRRLATLAQDPHIQQKLIKAIKKGVDKFAESLGPMGSMVQNFLNIETLEKVVKDYLEDKDGEIVKWLEDPEVQEKVGRSLRNSAEKYLHTPIVEYLQPETGFNVDKFSTGLRIHLLAILRQREVRNTLSSMLKENIEIYLQNGTISVDQVVEDLAGDGARDRVKDWAVKEGSGLLRSDEARKIIDFCVDRMVLSLLEKPVGKIADFIPAGVREGMYGSIQRVASDMLAVEVPGLVRSLNIRHIIAQKIDSLDLLRLERLLLSIMEEQFKYINLFGALLGFIIGSLNVLFLVLR